MNELEYYLSVYIFLFLMISIGLFLWLLPTHNFFVALGGSFIVCGILFSILAFSYIYFKLGEEK